MKLEFYRGEIPNFGDEINALMWKRILPPGFLDDDESELFLGIGSILWDKYPAGAMKHVMGSGYGGYDRPPDVHDGTWNAVFLRGPVTAARLGLPPESAVCDGAILLRALDFGTAPQRTAVGFMPHFHSIARGFWAKACAGAGIRFLDPRSDVASLIDEIRACRLVITEAMHGAIVSDALRTPWIPVVPIDSQHHLKWSDWAASLDLRLEKNRLPPSGLQELSMKLRLGRAYRRLKQLPLAGTPLAAADRMLTDRASAYMASLARREGNLSDVAVIDRKLDMALSRVAKFVQGRKAASL